MELKARVDSFEMLGRQIRSLTDPGNPIRDAGFISAVRKATAENPWFTEENILTSLRNISLALTREKIQKWLEPYFQRLSDKHAHFNKTIAVIMAGNIPAVGFHDFLCVLISGHRLLGRLSSQDSILIPFLAELLCKIDSKWKENIRFTRNQIEYFDALIATGNDNSSRYFDYYFRNYPNIIRKNRNSIAILTGHENPKELEGIADDCLLYFGLGCRSVSKIFVPPDYDFSAIGKAMEKYTHYLNHPKYHNNYIYNKSIYQVGQIPFQDHGFLLFKEDPELVSRIACIHYEYVQDIRKLETKIKEDRSKIQCVVALPSTAYKSIAPGKAQQPELWDYADDVDTMEFLLF